jgi:hypothetical protein
MGTMARYDSSGRERSFSDLVLFGSFDFSDVDVGFTPCVAVRSEYDRTRIRNLRCLVSLSTESAARIPTAPTIFGW